MDTLMYTINITHSSFNIVVLMNFSKLINVMLSFVDPKSLENDWVN